ncbi:ABC transporter permease [Rudaea sp.]|uniref:ABC transporter permease n=1 Tax=Rudaea sp. TaxID=2136325 RepID=UPI0039E6B20D
MLPLALKSLRNRRFTVALTVFTIALSVCLLLGVERVRTQMRESFASTVSGTDLIVGARSGPVNLLLYAIFHIGDATNNVSWQSYKEIAALPDVAWSVPISLGDSHRGYRVVGTTLDFFARYRYGAKHELAFAQGRTFSDLYDTVLGAEVARKLGYRPGDAIVIAHGTGRVAIAEHKDKPFRVAGILEATGTPVDASVFVSLEAIEAIHIDWQYGTRMPGSGVSADAARRLDLTPKTITAFLLGLKSRIATFGVQRTINEYEAEPLLAILPGVTLQQLWGLVGIAENALRLVSALVVLVGIAGMLTALVTTLAERRREMAILRALGARPLTVFGLLLLEALLLAACGALAGVALFYLALALARRALLDGYGIAVALTAPTRTEFALIGCVLLAGLVAGLVPAALAYRNALADGLTIRT